MCRECSSTVLCNLTLISLGFLYSLTYCKAYQYPRVILSSVNIYALRTRATYSCSAADAIGANWFLNGTDYRQLNLINTTEFYFNRTNVGIFIFRYLTGIYNNTHVQCESIFPGNETERSGNNKTLLIQGYLDSVGHLSYSFNDSLLIVTWEPPFTLDIPRVDPDITYCVSIESERGNNLTNVCDIVQSSYSYDFLGQFYGKYIVTVTPVNIVGKGEKSSIPVTWEIIITERRPKNGVMATTNMLNTYLFLCINSATLVIS